MTNNKLKSVIPTVIAAMVTGHVAPALADTSKSMQLLQGYLPLAGSGPVTPRAADAPYTPPSANLDRPGTVAIHKHTAPAQAPGKDDSKSRELLKQYLPLADTTAVHHSRARTLSYPVWVNQAHPQNAMLYHNAVTREQLPRKPHLGYSIHSMPILGPVNVSYGDSRKDTALSQSWNLLGKYLPLAKGEAVPVANASDVITGMTQSGLIASAQLGIMKPTWVAHDFHKSYFYPTYSGVEARLYDGVGETKDNMIAGVKGSVGRSAKAVSNAGSAVVSTVKSYPVASAVVGLGAAGLSYFGYKKYMRSSGGLVAAANGGGSGGTGGGGSGGTGGPGTGGGGSGGTGGPGTGGTAPVAAPVLDPMQAATAPAMTPGTIGDVSTDLSNPVSSELISTRSELDSNLPLAIARSMEDQKPGTAPAFFDGFDSLPENLQEEFFALQATLASINDREKELIKANSKTGELKKLWEQKEEAEKAIDEFEASAKKRARQQASALRAARTPMNAPGVKPGTIIVMTRASLELDIQKLTADLDTLNSRLDENRQLLSQATHQFDVAKENEAERARGPGMELLNRDEIIASFRSKSRGLDDEYRVLSQVMISTGVKLEQAKKHLREFEEIDQWN